MAVLFSNILTTLPHLQGCLRPSIAEDASSGGGSNEDPLSVQLSEILNMNEHIRVQLQGMPNKVRQSEE